MRYTNYDFLYGNQIKNKIKFIKSKNDCYFYGTPIDKLSEIENEFEKYNVDNIVDYKIEILKEIKNKMLKYFGE